MGHDVLQVQAFYPGFDKDLRIKMLLYFSGGMSTSDWVPAVGGLYDMGLPGQGFMDQSRYIYALCLCLIFASGDIAALSLSTLFDQTLQRWAIV